MNVNMSEQENPARRLYALSLLGAAFAGICILFFFSFIWFQPDQLSLSDRYFPSPTATLTHTPTLTPTFTPTTTQTPTPTSTPTPHAYLTPPDGVSVLEETFDSNARRWDTLYSNNTVRVGNGKLTLNSNERRFVGLALCLGCAKYNQEFYFQAELLPEKATSTNYGISFCESRIVTYYVFIINARLSTYTLNKHYPDDWKRLITNKGSNMINKYPLSNTLGVKYNEGIMDFYINGIMVDTYIDEDPFTCQRSGVFIEGGLLDLYVDNVFAYNIEGTANPTPTP